METGAFWIPNMKWGNGIGGWDLNTMYMQDRATDEPSFEVAAGAGGRGGALALRGRF